MLLDHVGRILDGVTGLLVGTGLLQDVGREDIADIVWAVGSQPLIAPRPVSGSNGANTDFSYRADKSTTRLACIEQASHEFNH